jgi:uncharacterized membrane protein YedE/YeeE
MIVLFLAVILSFLMGLAIQRGGTCTVAAIEEIVSKRTSNRIKALLETTLWVLAGELILAQFGVTPSPTPHWQMGLNTIIGGFLLGLGAFVNGACAVGTIARIGNREWEFFAMLPGFLFGAWLTGTLHFAFLQPINLGVITIQPVTPWILAFILVCVVYRAWQFYQKGFHPYVLTVLIGIFFLGLITLEKNWSYTDLLIDLAQFKTSSNHLQIILFISLLAGSMISGYFQKPSQRTLQKLSPHLLKRFIGGALMGAATLILPGSHDSLILLYMPKFLGYAWLGFLIMTSTIVILKLIKKKRQRASS